MSDDFRIVADILAQTSGFDQASATADSTFTQIQNAAVKAGEMIVGYFGARKIFSFLDEGVTKSLEYEKANAFLQMRLDRVGDSLGVARGQIEGYNEALYQNTQFTKIQLADASDIILTFDKIGKDSYPRLLKDAADLGAKFGDVAGAARAIGIAMEVPENASRLLRQYNVMLTTAQRESIVGYQKQNDLQSAQEVILQAIENAYSGVAEEYYKTTEPGRLAAMNKELDEQQRMVGQVLTPAWLEFKLLLVDVVKLWMQAGAGPLSGTGLPSYDKLTSPTPPLAEANFANDTEKLNSALAEQNRLREKSQNYLGQSPRWAGEIGREKVANDALVISLQAKVKAEDEDLKKKQAQAAWIAAHSGSEWDVTTGSADMNKPAAGKTGPETTFNYSAPYDFTLNAQQDFAKKMADTSRLWKQFADQGVTDYFDEINSSLAQGKVEIDKYQKSLIPATRSEQTFALAKQQTAENICNGTDAIDDNVKSLLKQGKAQQNAEKLITKAQDLIKQGQEQVFSTFSRGVAETIVSGTFDWEQALKSLATTMLDEVINYTFQLIMALVTEQTTVEALTGAYSALSVAKIVAQTAHGGGIAIRAGEEAVSFGASIVAHEGMIAGMPRMHVGGLKPGEVGPVVLQEGEGVMKHKSMQSIGNDTFRYMNATGKLPGGNLAIGDVHIHVDAAGDVRGMNWKHVVRHDIIPEIRDEFRRGNFLPAQRGN